jgi:hypothetical protein
MKFLSASLCSPCLSGERSRIETNSPNNPFGDSSFVRMTKSWANQTSCEILSKNMHNTLINNILIILTRFVKLQVIDIQLNMKSKILTTF